MSQLAFAPHAALTRRPITLAPAEPQGQAIGTVTPRSPATGAAAAKAAASPADGFDRPSGPSRAETQKLLGLFTNAGHTTQILDARAGLLERDGEHDKAAELRAIKDVYAQVGAADNGKGNCCSATSNTLKAMKERFAKEGLDHWDVQSIGVGKQADGSYAHQAIAVMEKGNDKPMFVLDPTKMPLIKIPGLPGQGATNGWDQAYTMSEFLRTREANYGSGWQLGVP